MAKSKSKLGASIANGVVLAEHLNHLRFVHSDFAEPDIAASEDVGYPQLANPVRLDLTSQQLVRLYQIRRGGSIDSIHLYKRCRLNRRTTIGSRESQVGSDTNRDDHRILYHSIRGERNFGVVEFFATVTDSNSSDDWAYVAILTGEIRHRQEGVIAVQQEGRHTWIQTGQIDGLIGLIKEGEARFYMIVSEEIDM